ncbi:hypothetical protein PG985_008046 [Apiospora marii]|uniref:Uncharacterized protein n=1 Tax=Apiospora marii TaxID=335849 RepID=A0ABR1R9J2_9PEZI
MDNDSLRLLYLPIQAQQHTVKFSRLVHLGPLGARACLGVNVDDPALVILGAGQVLVVDIDRDTLRVRGVLRAANLKLSQTVHEGKGLEAVANTSDDIGSIINDVVVWAMRRQVDDVLNLPVFDDPADVEGGNGHDASGLEVHHPVVLAVSLAGRGDVALLLLLGAGGAGGSSRAVRREVAQRGVLHVLDALGRHGDVFS